jgi:hypothetical protein
MDAGSNFVDRTVLDSVVPPGFVPTVVVFIVVGLVLAVWARQLLPHVLRFESFQREHRLFTFRPVNTKRLTTLVSLRAFGIVIAIFSSAALALSLLQLANES